MSKKIIQRLVFPLSVFTLTLVVALLHALDSHAATGNVGTYLLDEELVIAGGHRLAPGSVVNNTRLTFSILSGTEIVDNDISGTGQLVKTGRGTVKLLGVNTATGGVAVEEGKLVGTNRQSFGIGDIFIGKGATLQFEMDSYDLYPIHPDADDVVPNTLSGTGTVILGANLKDKDQALHIVRNNVFSGNMIVKSGTVFQNAQIGADFEVLRDAALGGCGETTGSLLFRSGSRHLLGNAINGGLSAFHANTITYEGNSTVYVKVGSEASDQVIAHKGIDFAQNGGSVNVVFVNLGDVKNDVTSKQYEIFTVTDGYLTLNGDIIKQMEVTGSTTLSNAPENVSVINTAGDTKRPYAAIEFIAESGSNIGIQGYSVMNSQTAKESRLLVNLSIVGGPTSYLNRNQAAAMRQVADAGIYDVVFSQPQSSRGSVVNELLPMIQTVAPIIAQRAISQYHIATSERLRYRREPSGGLIRLSELVFETGLNENSRADREIYRASSAKTSLEAHSRDIWFHNYGDFLNIKQTGHLPEFRASAYGCSFGIDRAITPRYVCGVAGSFHNSDLRISEYYQSGTSDAFLASIYSMALLEDDVVLISSFGGLFAEYKYDRRTPAFENALLRSEHSGMAVYANVELSRKFLAGRTEITPYGELGFNWLIEGSYSEDELPPGSPSLALKIRARDRFAPTHTLGLRVGRTFRMLGGNLLTPTGYIGWVHDWGSVEMRTRASFPGQPAFRIGGFKTFNDRLLTGVNVSMTANQRLDFFTRFNAEIANRYTAASVHLGVRYGF